jgi:hypothetical protein
VGRWAGIRRIFLGNAGKGTGIRRIWVRYILAEPRRLQQMVQTCVSNSVLQTVVCVSFSHICLFQLQLLDFFSTGAAGAHSIGTICKQKMFIET